MIIEKDSILNSLPIVVLTEKEICLFDAIVHCIKMFDISYSSLSDLLEEDAEDLSSEITMVHVWNIIDSSHRLRCLLEKSPGIKRKELWFLLTIKKLQQTEPFRNFIQHYNGEIDRLIAEVKPLLGHVSWFMNIDERQFKIGMIVPGTVRLFNNLKVVNPAGKLIRDKIDLIEFNIGDLHISISDLFYQVTEFKTGLESHIKNKIKLSSPL